MPRKNLLSESIAGLKGATKSAQTTATTPKAAKAGKSAQTTATGAIEARRGKSSDPAYVGINIYIKKETQLDAKRALLGEAADLSDLMQHLLAEWVKTKNPKS